MEKTAWEMFVVATVVATMKAQAEAGAVGQSVWKPVKDEAVDPWADYPGSP